MMNYVVSIEFLFAKHITQLFSGPGLGTWYWSLEYIIQESNESVMKWCGSDFSVSKKKNVCYIHK